MVKGLGKKVRNFQWGSKINVNHSLAFFFFGIYFLFLKAFNGKKIFKKKKGLTLLFVIVYKRVQCTMNKHLVTNAVIKNLL